MIITGDINDPVYQVRLMIGDVEEEFVIDQVIIDMLEKYGDDVRKVSIELLKAILAHTAGYLDEKVGGVEVEYSKLYDQKKSLLDKILKDPAYLTSMLDIIIGGTSKAQKEEYKDNTDIVGAPISTGFYTGDD